VGKLAAEPEFGPAITADSRSSRVPFMRLHGECAIWRQMTVPGGWEMGVLGRVGLLIFPLQPQSALIAVVASRMASSLKPRGSRAGPDAAIRSLPDTTCQVFHGEPDVPVLSSSSRARIAACVHRAWA
jgi:hypothetical protein